MMGGGIGGLSILLFTFAYFITNVVNMFLRIRSSVPICSGLICLWLLSAYNLSFWAQIWSVARLPFIVSIAITLAAIFYAFLLLFSFKYTYKPIAIISIIIAALSAYAVDTYGFIISAPVLQNILETDLRESMELLNWRLVIHVVLFALVPIAILFFTKLNYPTWRVRTVHILLCILLLLVNIAGFGRYYATVLRNNKEIRYYVNPIRPIYSLVKFVGIKLRHTQNYAFVELDPQPRLGATNGKPKLVVLVVGESDRAKNHQLNGYKRQTTPLLAARSHVYSFRNFYSCGTETLVSLPCMFSVFKRTDYSDLKGKYTENLLDILQKSQVQILWRDNDSGCKGVCSRVPTEDLNDSQLAPFFNNGECYDEILLHQLEDYINSNVTDKLIVLHKRGNHGPAYYKRYPAQFNTFTPICNSKELHNCTDQQIVNTYDNIILYTDYFLDQIIQMLEKNHAQYQTALLYVSDHGESLGENGIYLHAIPYLFAPKEQRHIPFILWFSEDFALVDRHKIAALQSQEFSHDHLFHTLLGMFNVQTIVYQPQLDIFGAS